jgi:hypothetical protein
MIGPMRVCRLVLAFGCLISSEAWGVDKPIPLKLEESTTLRVGELAVLQIPADHIRSHFSGAGNALVLVRHSRRTALYRAVRPGYETILLGPGVPQQDHCVSCATIHYFITVVAQK